MTSKDRFCGPSRPQRRHRLINRQLIDPTWHRIAYHKPRHNFHTSPQLVFWALLSCGTLNPRQVNCHLRPWWEGTSTPLLPHSHALTMIPCTLPPVARCSIRLRLAHELAHFAASSLVVILTRCVDQCRDGWSTTASRIHPRPTFSGHLKTTCGLQLSLEGNMVGRLRQYQRPERRDQADR